MLLVCCLFVFWLLRIVVGGLFFVCINVFLTFVIRRPQRGTRLCGPFVPVSYCLSLSISLLSQVPVSYCLSLSLLSQSQLLTVPSVFVQSYYLSLFVFSVLGVLLKLLGPRNQQGSPSKIYIALNYLASFVIQTRGPPTHILLPKTAPF